MGRDCNQESTLEITWIMIYSFIDFLPINQKVCKWICPLDPLSCWIFDLVKYGSSCEFEMKSKFIMQTYVHMYVSFLYIELLCCDIEWTNILCKICLDRKNSAEFNRMPNNNLNTKNVYTSFGCQVIDI